MGSTRGTSTRRTWLEADEAGAREAAAAQECVVCDEQSGPLCRRAGTPRTSSNMRPLCYS